MNRRELLTRLGAAAVVTVVAGCEKALPSPTPDRKTLDILSEADVKEAAKVAIVDFNKVLGLNLKESEIIPNIILVSDLSEYQRIISADMPSYVPQDETNRFAITTNPSSQSGNKIFIYKPAIEKATKFLPNTDQSKKARLEFLAFVLDHEFSHFSAATYKSNALHNEVFGKIFANIPALKGKKIEQEVVKGAMVYAKVENRPINAFSGVEEAEAILIDDLIVRKNGRPKLGKLPALNELGYVPQIEMCKELLAKLYPDLDQGLKSLANLRAEAGGREKFAAIIGEKFKIPPQDQLFFSMSMLYAIDIGDRNLFSIFINRPTQ